MRREVKSQCGLRTSHFARRDACWRRSSRGLRRRSSGRNRALDCVHEADELLMAMTLHNAADQRSVDHVHGRRTGSSFHAACSRGSRYRRGPFSSAGWAGFDRAPESGFFRQQRKRWLAPACRRRARRIAQFVDELGVLGELELPNAMRLEH
jgi:hypothetical protein